MSKIPLSDGQVWRRINLGYVVEYTILLKLPQLPTRKQMYLVQLLNTYGSPNPTYRLENENDLLSTFNDPRQPFDMERV